MVMISALMFAAAAISGEPDLVLYERPMSNAYGGAAVMSCGRMEVELRWLHRRQQGLVEFEGSMAQSLARRSLARTLAALRPDIEAVRRVRQECDAKPVETGSPIIGVRTILTVLPRNAGDSRSVEYVLTVHEGFVVEVTGPSEPFE